MVVRGLAPIQTLVAPMEAGGAALRQIQGVLILVFPVEIGALGLARTLEDQAVALVEVGEMVRDRILEAQMVVGLPTPAQSRRPPVHQARVQAGVVKPVMVLATARPLQALAMLTTQLPAPVLPPRRLVVPLAAIPTADILASALASPTPQARVMLPLTPLSTWAPTALTSKVIACPPSCRQSGG
jgi:hypothetical protein